MSITSPEHSFAPRYPRFGKPQEGQPLAGEELENRITALNKEMQEHQGELVLMVVRHWQKYGFDMPESQTPYGLDEDYYLGIIASPFLQVNNSHQIEIGVEKYAIFDERRSHLDIKKGEDKIWEWHAWDVNLDRMAKADDQHDLKPNKKLLEIIVGDNNVSEWVEREIREHRMPKHMLEPRDRLPERYEEKAADYFDTSLLNAFKKMYKAVDKELVLPEETAIKAKEELLKQKVRLLNSIDDLLQKEEGFKGKITRIFDIVKQGGGVLESSAGITPIEDEDDAKVLTMGHHQELNRIEAQIKSKLQEAIDVGMDTEELVLEKEIRPGHKEVLNVPIFIRSLAEKYDVELSQAETSSPRNSS